MIIQIDTKSETPIYLQLRNQIILGIGGGSLPLGSSLPTVRQLAGEIGVNTMTVNKTYAILKADGFIEIDRRHGATVIHGCEKSDIVKTDIENQLSLILTEATLKGCGKKEIMDICTNLLENLKVQYSENRLCNI